MSAKAGAKGAVGNGAFGATRRDHYHARHLPGDMYYSQEIYEREVERIWMKEWLCIGRVEQFPDVGDYKAMRIAGEPVVVCKNAKGRLTPGADGDVTIVDPVTGSATTTLAGGRVVLREGSVVGTGGTILVTAAGEGAARASGLEYAVLDVSRSKMYR